MKRIMLHIGDKLKALEKDPFNAKIAENEIVTVIGFNAGNSAPRANEEGPCPLVATASGQTWYTDLQLLFKKFKKETK